MANEIEKVNTIAITSIEKINTRTDDNIQELNTLEMTGQTYLSDLAYGGLTWTSATAVTATSYGTAHIGSATAGGYIGSDYTTLNEWAGSGTTGSWSTEDTLSVKHVAASAGGTVTAGIVHGGYDSDSSTTIETTEEYNGETWSTTGTKDMISGTYGGSGGGNVQTNQLHTGGSTYSPTVRDIASTEIYNGTTWSDAGDDSNGLSGSQSVGTTDWVKPTGTYDATGMQVACEYFTLSTTTWSSIANISNKTRYNKCWGDETRTFTCGGYERDDLGAPVYYSYHAVCEMWTDNAWASQTSMPTAHGGQGNGGSDGGTNVGGGWTAGGSERYSSLTTHYIAVAS